MSDNPFIQRRHAEAKSALVKLKRQRDTLNAEIAALEEVVRLEGEIFQRHGIDLREQASPSEHPAAASSRKSRPRYGSKRHRICVAASEFLADGQTRHRKEIADYLKQRGLINAVGQG